MHSCSIYWSNPLHMLIIQCISFPLGLHSPWLILHSLWMICRCKILYLPLCASQQDMTSICSPFLMVLSTSDSPYETKHPYPGHQAASMQTQPGSTPVMRGGA